MLFDIAAGTSVMTAQAHEKELWSLCLLPDKRGFVSGGGDSLVKFWEFEYEGTGAGTSDGGKQLQFVHTRTLQVLLLHPVLPDFTLF